MKVLKAFVNSGKNGAWMFDSLYNLDLYANDSSCVLEQHFPDMEYDEDNDKWLRDDYEFKFIVSDMDISFNQEGRGF